MNLNDIFSMIFEWLGYDGVFSDDVYAQDLYSSLGLCNLFISLFLVILFYFIINRPRFSKWYHWLFVLLVNFIINFLISFIVPQNIFDVLGIYYETLSYVIFGLKSGVIASVFFIIWTYVFKWWYGNAKGTPKLFFGKF